MINARANDAVGGSRFSATFRKPLYSSYCFSRIPATINYLLTGQGVQTLPLDVLGELPTRYRRVILLFVDAFGWRFFERYADDYPFLRRFVEEGVVSQLTAQFPSTTAAHVTTIHTGLPVGQSGVYEWFYYEPLLDRIIAPLLFSFAGETRRNGLKVTGISPEALYPTTTLYHELARAGVASYVYQPIEFAFSPYSKVVTDGAKMTAFRTLPEGLTDLTEALLAGDERAYYFLYTGNVDMIGHYRGPSSTFFDAEVDATLIALERLFAAKLAGKLDDTLLLLTADHGHMEIDPATAYYLNRELPDIGKYLRTNRAGDLLVPAGSSRDMFLHAREGHAADLADRLRSALGSTAEVYETRLLIEQGLFGDTAPSPTFLSRVGDVVILPYPGEAVWWYEQDRFEQPYFGNHGGLTPQELETLLLCHVFTKS